MITVLDVALKRMGLPADYDGSVTMEQVNQTGLPFFGGCQVCGESLAAHNMYPTRSGYVRCRACAESFGFNTVEAFEAFEED